MADSMNELTKKMMSQTIKQGASDYSEISISNHLDYEKWNNHQKYESTAPVFEVMGKFLGLPSIYEKTHKIFQDSWLYYADRGDLIDIKGDKMYNPNPNLIFVSLYSFNMPCIKCLYENGEWKSDNLDGAFATVLTQQLAMHVRAAHSTPKPSPTLRFIN